MMYYTSMEDIKKTISKNLIYYRTQAKLTQFELAQKLNYSDKSISKWERGAGIPDIVILKQLADLYNIKVDDFLKENTDVAIEQPPTNNKNVKHLITTLISVGLVWFVAKSAKVLACIHHRNSSINDSTNCTYKNMV